jgi:hypothetical protein
MVESGGGVQCLCGASKAWVLAVVGHGGPSWHVTVG